MLLKDKVVFLTGGSTGIGFECAKKYVREGARVVIAANHRAPVTEAIRVLGADHLGIVCDVSRPGEAKDAIAETLKEFQRINVIHNKAGIAEPSKMLNETDESELDLIINIKNRSTHIITKVINVHKVNRLLIETKN